VNNTFNLAYEFLKWKVHIAIVKAKLEPYPGFLHSVQFGKPSLVCDFQELYRYLIDDFVVQYCQALNKRDFITNTERLSRSKRGKREYLNDVQTPAMKKSLNRYLKSPVGIPRIKVGKRQTVETLIKEKALLPAKYPRNETLRWKPRITSFLD